MIKTDASGTPLSAKLLVKCRFTGPLSYATKFLLYMDFLYNYYCFNCYYYNYYSCFHNYYQTFEI